MITAMTNPAGRPDPDEQLQTFIRCWPRLSESRKHFMFALIMATVDLQKYGPPDLRDELHRFDLGTDEAVIVAWLVSHEYLTPDGDLAFRSQADLSEYN